MPDAKTNHPWRLFIAAAAAFSTYFCMYGFRKAFNAGTFEGEEVFGIGLKAALVISQLAGYMLSKFIGIRVISELGSRYRALGIVLLILFAEATLVGFAYVPVPWKLVMLFLNGLPLGMIFGLVMAYLEGRRQTEALSAALCASFIMSSGVVKSVGRWLIQEHGVGEFVMPMLTGLIFLPPLLLSVGVLQTTPPPDAQDRHERNERKAINRQQRWDFLSAYFPGLSLLLFVFISLTIVRTIRDDFGVELWRDLGVDKTPSIYATSETIVAFVVTGMAALMIWIPQNLIALRVTAGLMCAAFGLALGSVVLRSSGTISPFVFMVACGIGLYVPYVAFHTTVFERLIAASPHPSNLGFLMYLADSLGYLGLAVVMAAKTGLAVPGKVLPFFQGTLSIVSISSIVALIAAMVYFHRVLSNAPAPAPAPPAPELLEMAE
ncbi:MAG: DUF5690 family protein [Planctomycetaceae bacterium]